MNADERFEAVQLWHTMFRDHPYYKCRILKFCFSGKKEDLVCEEIDWLKI